MSLSGSTNLILPSGVKANTLPSKSSMKKRPHQLENVGGGF
jgi:hypothetical protein